MKHSSNSVLLGSIIMGVGLITLGAALFAFYVIDPFSSSSSYSSGGDYSTVPAKVNYPAPNVQLTDLNNNPVSLGNYRGKVALVNLWATWCPPCKAEMPTLQSFYEEHKDQGFVIVAIDDGESRELVADFVRSYGLTFPVWLDPQYKTERSFGTSSLPTSWVIDRQGQVVLTWVGAISKQMLDKYVIPIIEG